MRRFILDAVGETVRLPGTAETHTHSNGVAQGVVFYDGTTTLRWLGKTPSTASYASLADFKAIHHVVPKSDTTLGKRWIRWIDPICFRCGATLEHFEIGGWCYSCGAGQGKVPHLEDEPDPSLGSWSLAMVIGPGPEAKL